MNMFSHPGKVEMRLIVTADAIIGHLQFFGGLHVQTCKKRFFIVLSSKEYV